MNEINFVLIGAGEFGGEIGSICKDIEKKLFPKFVFRGYIDDDPSKQGKSIYGRNVLGGMDWIKHQDEKIYFTVTIGDPVIRKKVAEKAEELGYLPYSIISPDFVKREEVEIGAGSIFLSGVVFTNGQKIGRYAHIHEGVMCGHKVRVGDFGTLAPGAVIFGGCEIGEGAYIGGNATMLQFKKVGGWSVVGAGSVVLKNIPNYQVWVGNPAHKIKDFGYWEQRRNYKL